MRILLAAIPIGLACCCNSALALDDTPTYAALPPAKGDDARPALRPAVLAAAKRAAAESDAGRRLPKALAAAPALPAAPILAPAPAKSGPAPVPLAEKAIWKIP